MMKKVANEKKLDQSINQSNKIEEKKRKKNWIFKSFFKIGSGSSGGGGSGGSGNEKKIDWQV